MPREAAVPVTSQTLFRWASVSKTLTAVAAMQLVEEVRIGHVAFVVFDDEGHS